MQILGNWMGSDKNIDFQLNECHATQKSNVKWIESWEKSAGWGLYFSHEQMKCLRISNYKETQHFASGHNKYHKAWIIDNDKLLNVTTESVSYYYYKQTLLCFLFCPSGSSHMNLNSFSRVSLIFTSAD